MSHQEMHRSHRVGWLRAAVLGAYDGVVSTASLIISVAAGGATQESVLLAGVAGLSEPIWQWRKHHWSTFSTLKKMNLQTFMNAGESP